MEWKTKLIYISIKIKKKFHKPKELAIRSTENVFDYHPKKLTGNKIYLCKGKDISPDRRGSWAQKPG